MLNVQQQNFRNYEDIYFPKCVPDSSIYDFQDQTRYFYNEKYYNSFNDESVNMSEFCLPYPDEFYLPLSDSNRSYSPFEPENKSESNSIRYTRAPFPPKTPLYNDQDHPTIFSYAYPNDGLWIFAQKSQLNFANEILIPYPFKDNYNRIIYPLMEIDMNYMDCDKKIKVTYPFALQSQKTGEVHYTVPYIPPDKGYITTMLCGVQDTSLAWNYFFFPRMLINKLNRQIYRTLPYGVRDSYGNYLCIATSNTVFCNNNNVYRRAQTVHRNHNSHFYRQPCCVFP